MSQITADDIPNDFRSIREDVQRVLEAIGGDTIQKVYFQPPASLHIQYPCIIYSFTNYTTTYAEDVRYSTWCEFSVTIVDKDPESQVPQAMLNLQKEYPAFSIRFDRFYISDNLNHWVYRLIHSKSI